MSLSGQVCSGPSLAVLAGAPPRIRARDPAVVDDANGWDARAALAGLRPWRRDRMPGDVERGRCRRAPRPRSRQSCPVAPAGPARSGRWTWGKGADVTRPAGEALTPERWRRVKALLESALERAPAERAAFLETMCGADPLLRAEVMSLLAAVNGATPVPELSVGAARALAAHARAQAEAEGAGDGAAAAHVRATLDAVLAGRYTVERELGRGGMATVYLARDLRHRRSVAVKVLDPTLGAVLGPSRFRREVETSARLSHPHILPLFDSGEADGLLYYVMPYVVGESLRDRLRRDRHLSVPEAVRIVREVSDALDYAHRHDVVHRDVKPENVLLDEDGHALVADFGIARAVHHATAGANEPRDLITTLTQTGIAIGTPAYMSPEQALGEHDVDGRSDVYALGCVAFELLAGEAPYRGSSAEQLAQRLTQPPPALTTRRPELPSAVDAALARALAVAPHDRFPTASAFAMEFAAALAGTDGGVRTAARASDQGRDAARGTNPPAAPSPGSVPPSMTPRPFRTRSALLLVALLALVAAAGVFARGRIGWTGSSAMATESEEVGAGTDLPRVAVLPFENLGDSTDAYFVDGLSDEVRGKLAALPTLQVIARASSNEYRRTTKRHEVIARELGVEYLVTGTVRSARGRSSPGSRVRVTPELVRVSRARAPVTVWQRGIDADVVDLFQVQSAIAQEVAEGLDVTLGAADRSRLAARPTASLAAYDAFLQAEQIYGLANQDAPSLLRAIRLYERAVALDSTFAHAWARLGQAQAGLALASPSSVGSRDAARRAASRAITLAPESPVARLAMGQYYKGVESDPVLAVEQFRIGLRAAPNDAELLAALAWAEEGLGQWDAATEHFRRAAAIDPRGLNPARFLGLALLWQRRYPEARAALERALALAPADLTTLHVRATVELAEGNLAGAHAVLRRTPREIDPAVLVAFMATVYDFGWALDDAHQRLLLGLGPEPFGGDRGMWGIALAHAHAAQGNPSAARAFADSALGGLQVALRQAPDDPNVRANLGVALAYLGRRDAAVREGQRSVALVPITKDAYSGPYFQLQLARIYLLVGARDSALDQLEPLLRIPFYLSPGMLRIDPTFAPLRGHPRFTRLLRQAP